jgi:hypothetical protein
MRKNPEIEKELREIGHSPAFFPTENVFSVPEDYFESFPLKLMSELESVTSEELPDGYFEDLPSTIVKKVRNTDSIKSTPIRWIVRMAAAAIVTGLLGWGLYSVIDIRTNNRKSTDNETVETINNSKGNVVNFDEELDEVSDEAVISFLEDNGHDVPAGLMASLYDEKDLPNYTDFIVNENELHDYLKKIHFNTISHIHSN